MDQSSCPMTTGWSPLEVKRARSKAGHSLTCTEKVAICVYTNLQTPTRHHGVDSFARFSPLSRLLPESKTYVEQSALSTFQND